MTDPRTTVIIPVYNGEDYIREAIESVLAQTVPCSLMVVDDGSTDNSVELALSYVFSALIDFNVVSLKPSRGAAAALNIGIEDAQTEFVCWLSHDDVFHPEKIAHQEAVMDITGASACYTDYDIIAADGTWSSTIEVKPPVDGGMFRQVCVRNIINGSSIMIRRKVFDEVGLFREDLMVDVDGEMWLRMLAYGHQFIHLPEVLLKYRRHAGQLSANKALMLKTKDAVRAEWIEKAPVQMVFLGLGGDMGMASLLQRQGLTQAAEAVRLKAKEVV